MARRKQTDRISWRTRGGPPRAYGDFRDYADAGGKREPLVAPGELLATTDPVVARVLLGRRLEQLDARRRGKALHGDVKTCTLGDAVRRHLIAKAESGRVTDSWLVATERALTRALAVLGAGLDPRAVEVEDVRRLIAHLRRQPTKRRAVDGGCRTMSDGTVRHHLNALSNLYARLASEQFVPPGFNPVAALMEKPVGRPAEAAWLEIHEAALVLEAARRHRPVERFGGIPFAYPLVATFLLTGGRESEVLGLELDDVSFERKTITFRPNRWRGLKTERSGMAMRTVPLWPQLEEILRGYLRAPNRPTGELLFPAIIGGREQMLTDFRKTLNAIALAAGFLTREVGAHGKVTLRGRFLRTKAFRHTYTAARLQTIDQGAPVSTYTVRRELGHQSDAMINRVYGHLGQVRHRAEVVEFRVEQHQERLKDHLGTVSFVAPAPEP